MPILSYEEFMVVNNGKKLFKLFPKDLKCHDIQYEENKTFYANNFTEVTCRDGIYFTQLDYLFEWLCFRTNSYYICEIIPRKDAQYILENNKIKTNICDVGKLYQNIIGFLCEEVELTEEDLMADKKHFITWVSRSCCIIAYLYEIKLIKLINKDHEPLEDIVFKLGRVIQNDETIKYLDNKFAVNDTESHKCEYMIILNENTKCFEIHDYIK